MGNAAVGPVDANENIVPIENHVEDAKVSNTEGQVEVKRQTISAKKLVPLQSQEVPSTDMTTDGELEDDIDPIDILFQFIPYYSQGDPSNDSLVRSTLSGLSVEDIDKKDEYGNTLLLLACQYKCEDLVRIMLNKGADPNALNYAGATCLHFPCYKETQSKTIAKILLQGGANPEVSETTYGCTPLHYAASTGDVDFCKMLISYGAFVGTRDYYNYTCVDYAREAGMHDAAAFLQKKMLAVASQGPQGFGRSNSNVSSVMKSSIGEAIIRDMFPENVPLTASKYLISDNWEEGFDPVSGNLYYRNSSTGECLWEDEYRLKVKPVTVIVDKKISSTDVATPAKPIITEKISEKNMLKDQAKEPTEVVAQSPLKLTRNSDHNSSMDQMAMKKILEESKMLADKQLEDERKEFRSLISEKDGKIAKLDSRIEELQREKSELESKIAEMKEKLSQVQQSGGQALKDATDSLEKAEQEIVTLQSQLASTEANYHSESQKLKSLRDTLTNSEFSESERIAQEQKAAQERAELQSKRELEHSIAIKEREDKIAEIKHKAILDIQKLKEDAAVAERTLTDRFEVQKKQIEDRIMEMSRDMAERKSKFAEELSNAQQLATANHKRAIEADTAANASLELQKLMEAEIAEAREVQKFNAQLHRDLGREQAHRKRLHNEIEDMKGKIRVYVRIRPFSKTEAERGCTEAVVKDGKLSVCVKGLGGVADAKKIFDFDSVFGGSMTDGNSQVDIFKDSKHLMMSVIDGYNVCIFAYGQTGSGKTFTMIGATDIGESVKENGEFDELAGVAPRAVTEIFRLLNERTAQITYEVEVQMFQLYRDGLEDLLVDTKKKKKTGDEAKHGGTLKITLAEHSANGIVTVEGAVTVAAENAKEVMNVFSQGAGRRTTGATHMNAESSRSHLICCLVIRMTNRRSNTTTLGKLTLVDLAGSERVDKSGATGEMLKEAQSINKSLSALGDVIASLTSGADHIPYRNHPLTMLMSDSIGGNAKTLMFVNCSPADYNVSETNSSLGFASRCKDVTNSGGASNAVQAQQMIALKKELAKLKKENKGKPNEKGQLQRPT